MDFHEQESFACDTRSQRASRIRALSIGVQKGPPIGVQKGPRLSSGVTGMAGVPFALVAA